MIFTVALIAALAGRKTQTMRIATPGDCLQVKSRRRAVRRADGRIRWEVGRVYAIQPGRCKAAAGYFRCTYLREIRNPMRISPDTAKKEGFESLAHFKAAWRKINPNPHRRCFAIGMELIASGSKGKP